MYDLDFSVVLLEPLYDGNVGSVARVMKNFGFRELVLVNPCSLGRDARLMALHAWDILEGARTADSLTKAVEESNLVIGTTCRPGKTEGEHIRMPAYPPYIVREKLAGRGGKASLVFGREDTGLMREELSACDMILSIPTKEEYPSLNLSHAVAVVLYELSDMEPGRINLARRFDLELLYKHFSDLLQDINYKEHKREKTLLMIRRILGRAALTGREVQTLRGVLRASQMYKSKCSDNPK